MSTKKINFVPLEVSVHWRYLHQDLGKTWKEIHSDKKKGYHKFSKATICRHMKKGITDKVIDKRKHNKGRPKKLSERDHRHINRQVEVLRSRGEVNFTVKRVKVMAGLSRTVCDESVRLVLHSAGYACRRAAKKGVLSKNDVDSRYTFAKKVNAKFDDRTLLWKEAIAFYLDGASFTHKYDPLDQAQAPRTMLWRRKSERLSFGLTAKSNHEGTGGTQVHFLVGIGYGRGVVLCEQYEGRLNGQKFADFVRERLPEAFKESVNPRGKLFLQDGDPSQNSKLAKDAIYSIGARKFSIPPRSPDLNPIENIFHLVKAELRQQALDRYIGWENLQTFTERVKNTIENTTTDIIDKTIASMEKRINLVLKYKGERCKY